MLICAEHRAFVAALPSSSTRFLTSCARVCSPQVGEPLPLDKFPFFLFGKERRVADVPTDHPSCSRQHAVIVFRWGCRGGFAEASVAVWPPRLACSEGKHHRGLTRAGVVVFLLADERLACDLARLAGRWSARPAWRGWWCRTSSTWRQSTARSSTGRGSKRAGGLTGMVLYLLQPGEGVGMINCRRVHCCEGWRTQLWHKVRFKASLISGHTHARARTHTHTHTHTRANAGWAWRNLWLCAAMLKGRHFRMVDHPPNPCIMSVLAGLAAGTWSCWSGTSSASA